MDEKQKLAAIIKVYHDGSDYEGQAKIELLTEHLKNDEQEYMMTTYAKQVNNPRPGAGHKINPDVGLAPIRQKYLEQIDGTAREHDFTGPTLEEMQEKLNEPLTAQTTQQEKSKEQQDADESRARMEEYLKNMRSIRNPGDGPKLY